MFEHSAVDMMSLDWTSEMQGRAYMHHLGIPSSVRAVEQVQHILLKLLTVTVDVLAGLWFNQSGCNARMRNVDAPSRNEVSRPPSRR